MPDDQHAFTAPTVDSDIELQNLTELETRAEGVLDKGPFGYICGGSGDEVTLRENISSFDDYRIIPRYLTGLDEPDISTEIFGERVQAPIFCPPMAAHGLAHDTAEAGTARGWAASGCLYAMTTLSNSALDEVAAASRGGPKWFQLYFARDQGVNRELIARAKAAGATAMVFTVDLEQPGNREADARNDFHFPSTLPFPNIPGLKGGESLKEIVQLFKHGLDWDDVDFIKEASGLPVVIKGLLSPEDAREAVKRGAAGVAVSNHGGRQLDNVPGAFVALPAVAEAVDGNAAVFLDGGVRRGVHVLEALAAGATAVGVGRPTLYSAALGGWRGVHAMVETLKKEFSLAMKLAGVAKVSDITSGLIRPRNP